MWFHSYDHLHVKQILISQEFFQIKVFFFTTEFFAAYTLKWKIVSCKQSLKYKTPPMTNDNKTCKLTIRSGLSVIFVNVVLILLSIRLSGGLTSSADQSMLGNASSMNLQEWKVAYNWWTETASLSKLQSWIFSYWIKNHTADT